jgi:hypothetical protein
MCVRFLRSTHEQQTANQHGAGGDLDVHIHAGLRAFDNLAVPSLCSHILPPQQQSVGVHQALL